LINSLKNKNILFRADSSSKIGIGHIMRDLVLANRYIKMGGNIIFASQDLNGNINKQIIDTGFKVKILKSNSKKELVRLIKKLMIDLLVIDHYKINYKKEKYIKKKTKVKILSLDDTYKKHYCDILINHNINAKKKKYKFLTPKFCKIRCGGKYTLLRDEFYKEKNKVYKKNKKIKKVFIAMGGADTGELNIKILNILKEFKNIQANIVTTTTNKHLHKLKKISTNDKTIKLHINSTKIAKLMRKSHFAIITPSVTLNEVYFMKLKFIAIKTADNQKNIYKFLKKKNYIALNKFNKHKLYKCIKKF